MVRSTFCSKYGLILISKDSGNIRVSSMLKMSPVPILTRLSCCMGIKYHPVYSWASIKWPPIKQPPSTPGGGVLPYITYTGMCRPTGSWFWSSWFRTGNPFQRRFARKLQFCKQPFEIIQGQIAFKNTVQCVNKQTVVLLLHPRTEYRKLAHF